jgi:hypothetical protein
LIEMQTTLRKTAAFAVAALAWMALTAGAATAAPTEIGVHGTQTPINEAQGTFAMHGGLVGTWYTLTFNPFYASNTLLIASGQEKFVGCLDRNGHAGCQGADPSGSLSFRYFYWASFKASNGALIAGHCTHPITGGTGAFAGARGILSMRDRPVGAGVRTTYHGTVVLGAVSPAGRLAVGT